MTEYKSIQVPIAFGSIKCMPDVDPEQPFLCINEDDTEVARFDTYYKAHLYLLMQYTLKMQAQNTDSETSESYAKNQIDNFLNGIRSSYGEVRNLNLANSQEERDQGINYNNPLHNATLAELFFRYKADKFPTISVHTAENYEARFKKVAHLHNKRFIDIRFSDIEKVIQAEKEAGRAYATRKQIKIFFNQLYKYAISNEITTKNIAQYINLGKRGIIERRIPLTYEQIALLFKHVDEDPFVETVIMLIFTGCRINEFLNIRREDVNLTERYIKITNSKTDAGRNRLIPINKKIFKYIRKRMRAKSDYLLHDARGRKIRYEDYSVKFRNCMKSFGFKKITPHCCRHTLATMLNSAGADRLSTQRILGHVTNAAGITSIYIHLQLADLRKAMDMV